MDTLRYTIAFVLGILLPLLVQRWDLRRLRTDQRAGTWNYASWGAALYAFGPLSMIGWVWVAHHDWTRWRQRGRAIAVARTVLLLLLGVAAAGLVVGAIVAMDALFALTFGLPL